MERLQGLGLMLALKGILPFMLVTNNFGNSKNVGVKVNINVARIAEALIIAFITAIVTSYVSVKLLEQRLNFVEQKQDSYAESNAEYHKSLEKQIDRMQSMLENSTIKRR